MSARPVYIGLRYIVTRCCKMPHYVANHYIDSRKKEFIIPCIGGSQNGKRHSTDRRGGRIQSCYICPSPYGLGWFHSEWDHIPRHGSGRGSGPRGALIGGEYRCLGGSPRKAVCVTFAARSYWKHDGYQDDRQGRIDGLSVNRSRSSGIRHKHT